MKRRIVSTEEKFPLFFKKDTVIVSRFSFQRKGMEVIPADNGFRSMWLAHFYMYIISYKNEDKMNET